MSTVDPSAHASSVAAKPGHPPSTSADCAAERATGEASPFGEGFVIENSNPAGLDAALTAACDYRGDVTLTLDDGRVIDGFVYDRRPARDGRPAGVRLLPRDGGDRITVDEPTIARLQVTGKDTAAGKSFENWVKRYAEKKLRGQTASIESESLEDGA